MPTTMQFLITLSFDGHINDEDLARSAFRLQLHADLADLLLNGHIDREPGSGPWGWLHASLDRVQVHTITDSAPVAAAEVLPDLQLDRGELARLVSILEDVAGGRDPLSLHSPGMESLVRASAAKAAQHFRALQATDRTVVTA